MIVRYVSVELLILAFFDVRLAVVIGVSRKHFSLQAIVTFASAFKVVFGLIHHRRQVLVILSAAESFSRNDDLVLAIHNRLAVIALDGAVRAEHLRRVIVGDIAFKLFAGGAILRLILF